MIEYENPDMAVAAILGLHGWIVGIEIWNYRFSKRNHGAEDDHPTSGKPTIERNRRRRGVQHWVHLGTHGVGLKGMYIFRLL
jgi:hypothetical protein